MADKLSAPAAVGSPAWGSDTASCWLCGAFLHKSQLMPDGGPACADVRWYCRDMLACTDRWTSTGRRA